MMKRTEKSKANSRQEKSTGNGRQKSKANSRQKKSIANSRQKSRANSRQSKPKDSDRDKVKYEVKYEGKYTTEEKLQSASQSRSIQEPRQMSSTGSRGKKELKREEGIAKIPEIDFNEEIVEYKRIIQAVQQLKTATTS